DNTVEVLQKLNSNCAGKLTVINHDINQGKGEALKTGFNYIVHKNYSGAITIDADGQHDVEEIQNFLDEIEKYNPDLIVGSRFNNTREMPFIRRFVNYFTSWIISGIAGKKIADVQSGYRFLNLKVLKNIKLETKNFDTEPEILLKAGWMNYYIKNIPIKTIYHLDEFKSHVNPVKDTIKFFKLVFRSLVWKKRFLKEIKSA
ncbi:glycosyltransferase family 2 protein, partial [bacterium]|nr:glycosyltransferase family 2 protein [bacterium]